MARPRSFETDDALAAAMACFREHGFEATSIRDLEAATGLRAASIYGAFGNKATLYGAALDRYRDVVVRRRIQTHLSPDAGLAGIREFFSSTYTSEPLPEHGCMVATGSIESERLDPNARSLIDDSLEEMRAAFQRVLDRCAATGEIDPTLDRATAADLLLVVYQGQLGLMRGPRGHGAVDFDEPLRMVLEGFAPDRTAHTDSTHSASTHTEKKESHR